LVAAANGFFVRLVDKKGIRDAPIDGELNPRAGGRGSRSGNSRARQGDSHGVPIHSDSKEFLHKQSKNLVNRLENSFICRLRVAAILISSSLNALAAMSLAKCCISLLGNL
jgi:hypothetical protein